MAASRLKVKVPVATLIAQAEAARTRIVQKHEEEVAKQAKQAEVWARQAVVALDQVKERILAGDPPDSEVSWSPRRRGDDISEVRVEVDAAAPAVPRSDPPTDAIDRDIALLKATTETELAVGVDDHFARYLR